MNETTKQEQAWEEQVRERLDDSAAALDEVTATRLRAARAQAVSGMRERPGAWSGWWLPVGGLATAAVAALVFVLVQQAPEPVPPPAGLADVELLSSSVDLELLDELEFYEWLALENGNAG